jgi:hypothetical protein
MDFRSLLTEIPSGFGKDLYIREVGRSASHFKSLLKLSLHEKDPLAWRAAWILDRSDEKHPGLAVPHFPEIMRRLPGIRSTGVIRSLLRMLSRYEIPENDQGVLVDLCFGYMTSALYPVAVKVHAMQIIYNHVLLYPELKGELRTVIEDQIAHNSVGFKSRGMRIIRHLEQL